MGVINVLCTGRLLVGNCVGEVCLLMFFVVGVEHRINAVSHLGKVCWFSLSLFLPRMLYQLDLNTYNVHKFTVSSLIVKKFNSTSFIAPKHSTDTIEMSTHLLVAHTAFNIYHM